MNNQQLLNNWLGDRRRKYADGISLFDKLAREQVKERYGAYLRSGINEVVGQFDPRFSMLINELTRISRDIVIQPSLYPSALEETAVKEDAPKVNKVKTVVVKSVSDIGNLQTGLDEMGARIDDLEGDMALQASSIDDLSERVDDLSKPGIKVVTEASMPPSIRKCYDRIKEIVPLYARLHADISHQDITDAERKELADKLCDLDDERRKLWGRIDEWSVGKELDVDAERPQYSDDPLVRGYEYARAVRRLKENIRNSLRSAEKAKKDGRKVVYDNAMRRIAGYEKELEEIEHNMSS